MLWDQGVWCVVQCSQYFIMSPYAALMMDVHAVEEAGHGGGRYLVELDKDGRTSEALLSQMEAGAAIGIRCRTTARTTKRRPPRGGEIIMALVGFCLAP